jgi:D-tyrosyl-tRNA(Tyr) deacylase
MKVIVQRVNHANCIVDGSITGVIHNGLVAYVGFTHTDTIDDVKYLARKLVNLRIFDDANGVMNKSLINKDYAILSISQFTLYGDTTKGHRPSYQDAMQPVPAERLYQAFNTELQTTYDVHVQTGIFGAHMTIYQENDGPVTIELRSKSK